MDNQTSQNKKQEKNSMSYDYLVVGAGLFGAIFAYEAVKKGKKVLVVDDEKPICDLIDINLSTAGYHCRCVQDGLAAIDLIEKENFDLILLDIMLPGADGFDIMEYIKSLFDITVDVLWVDLMKQEDDELDRFAVENGLPVNQYSAYKTVMQEVRWI